MKLLNVSGEDLGSILVDGPDLFKSIDDILDLHDNTKSRNWLKCRNIKFPI